MRAGYPTDIVNSIANAPLVELDQRGSGIYKFIKGDGVPIPNVRLVYYANGADTRINTIEVKADGRWTMHFLRHTKPKSIWREASAFMLRKGLYRPIRLKFHRRTPHPVAIVNGVKIRLHSASARSFESGTVPWPGFVDEEVLTAADDPVELSVSIHGQTNKIRYSHAMYGGKDTLNYVWVYFFSEKPGLSGIVSYERQKQRFRLKDVRVSVMTKSEVQSYVKQQEEMHYLED